MGAGAGRRMRRVSRTLNENNVPSAELGLLSADAARDPPHVDLVVRTLLRRRRRVLRAHEVPRVESYPRLSAETSPARGDHLCRAVRLLAGSSPSGRRLRRGHCSDGAGCGQCLPVDDSVSRHDRQPALIHARIRRASVQHDRRRDVQPRRHSGLYSHPQPLPSSSSAPFVTCSVPYLGQVTCLSACLFLVCVKLLKSLSVNFREIWEGALSDHSGGQSNRLFFRVTSGF